MSTRLSGEVICFADDTNVFYIGDTIDVIASAMRTDLEVIKKWVSMNQLFVNVNKTNYIIFSKPNKKVENINDLKWDEIDIERKSVAKFLGFCIDENLTWEDHLKYVISKVSPVVRNLWRLKSVLTAQAKKCVYFGLIQSHLLYLCLIWSNASMEILEPLRILHNRAIKTLYGMHPRTSSKDVYLQTGLLDVPQLSFFIGSYFRFYGNKGFLA